MTVLNDLLLNLPWNHGCADMFKKVSLLGDRALICSFPHLHLLMRFAQLCGVNTLTMARVTLPTQHPLSTW